MRSSRLAAIGLAIVLIPGLVWLAVVAIGHRSDLLQTTGVLPVLPVAPMGPGSEACQNDLGVAQAFSRVRFNVGTFGRPGPPLTVTVRTSTGAPLASGSVASGWIDNGTPQNVYVGRVPAGKLVSVCIANAGHVRAYVYGLTPHGNIRTNILGITPTITPSGATVDGTPIPGDMGISFVSQKPRSLLSRLPAAFTFAGRFRPSFVGAWTYWVLLACILFLVPFMLWRALAWALSARPEPELAPLPEPDVEAPENGDRSAAGARYAGAE